MRTSDYDYDLPRDLVATHPASRRDESRLLVMQRPAGTLEHRHFRDLTEYLRPGDLLVMNDTRVMRARLRGVRPATGARVEALLLEPAPTLNTVAGYPCWTAMCRPARKMPVGEVVIFGEGALTARVTAEGEEGQRTLEFITDDLQGALEQFGEVPLPPYIVQRRKELAEAAADATSDDSPADAERYQTVYAREGTSVAAPTAGLHFTPELLADLKAAGVQQAFVTLHVGAGTFKPVEVDDPAEHPIHSEVYEVPAETAEQIARTRAAGGRVIAVGTTTVRALESAWDAEAQSFASGVRSTRLLILPGYRFGVIDAMITNFHLPRSSLLMLVAAFAGHAETMHAYGQAIGNGYRFYSYGDSMLIL